MKRTLLVSLAATVPVAALAVGSAMAQPPKATANPIVSYASIESLGTHRPNWHISIISPVVVVVSDKPSTSGMLAATPHEAANSLDS